MESFGSISSFLSLLFTDAADSCSGKATLTHPPFQLPVQHQRVRDSVCNLLLKTVEHSATRAKYFPRESMKTKHVQRGTFCRWMSDPFTDFSSPLPVLICKKTHSSTLLVNSSDVSSSPLCCSRPTVLWLHRSGRPLVSLCKWSADVCELLFGPFFSRTYVVESSLGHCQTSRLWVSIG